MEFVCPRCASPVEDEDFYGPCALCRDALRATMGGERGDVVMTAYEPKMNVVPNQIATKD